jgi:hypothetical protein
MDEYAKNFKRPGINSHKDLLWYGKHENYRYYKHTDKEVKDGTRKTGERKDGRQDHIQIIVSRKDITNTIKLSPQNTSKGKNKEHSAKLGEFNRTAFKQSGESLFDILFDFDRGLEDTLAYANTMQNGTVIQKKQMNLLQNIPNQKADQIIINDLGKSVAEGVFESVGEMIGTAGKLGADLLNILMEPVYVAPQADLMEPKKRKKKKKNIEQSRGLSF